MLIETDILCAFVKNTDRLKPVADKLLWRIHEGELGRVYASREALHELYYVSMREGVSLDEYVRRATALTAIPNLHFVPTTSEVDLARPCPHETVPSNINIRRLQRGDRAQPVGRPHGRLDRPTTLQPIHRSLEQQTTDSSANTRLKVDRVDLAGGSYRRRPATD